MQIIMTKIAIYKNFGKQLYTIASKLKRFGVAKCSTGALESSFLYRTNKKSRLICGLDTIMYYLYVSNC